MRTNMTRRALPALLALGLAACAAVPADYAGSDPRLRIEEFFAGHVTGYGMVQGLTGKVSQRLRVDIYGAPLEDGAFALREYFVYADGRREYREWRIETVGAHGYRGYSQDVVGVARGEARGFALNLDYVLRVPVDGEVYELRFDDWMYRQSENVVLNRAVFSKFGLELGSVTLVFLRRHDAARAPPVEAFLAGELPGGPGFLANPDD